VELVVSRVEESLFQLDVSHRVSYVAVAREIHNVKDVFGFMVEHRSFSVTKRVERYF